MAFIHDAQEILTEQEVDLLKELAKKSADFESTKEEDEKLAALKKQVHDGVAKRDRAKNLKVLAGKTYTLEEVIAAGGYTILDVKAALKAMGPATAVDGVHFATYKVGETDHKVMSKGRLDKTAMEAVKEGGVKTFVESATDLTWVLAKHKATHGTNKGKEVYTNIDSIVKRFGFNRDELIKQAEAKHTKDAKAATVAAAKT